MSTTRRSLVISVRQEPRLERHWSTADTLLYNVMTMNLAVMFTVPFLTAVAFYPQGSLPVAIIIAGILCCAEAVVYAFLASSMPRSGGDYYFQSRLMTHSVGTLFAFAGVVLGGALWMAIAGWFAAHVAVGPLFTSLNRLTGLEGFAHAAAFAQSGTGVFVLSLAVIAWSGVINVWGMRPYAVFQRVCWILGSAAGLIVVGLLWWYGAAALGTGAPYREALARAYEIGFATPTGSAALAATLGLVPVAAFSLIYPAWSVQQAGELRPARSLRSQLVSIVGAEALTVAISVLVVDLVLAHVDREALAGSAYLFFFAPEKMPYPGVPFFWFYNGAVWPSGIAVLCLCVLFNAWFWMWVPDITLAASRILRSMAFDRSLPRWVGDEWGRRRVPAKAIVLFSALCLVPAALYAYTSLWRLTLSVTLLNVLAFVVTCGAAAGLPYLHRELYRESTASRFELLGVPVITWCGAAFCAFGGFLVYSFATDPLLALGAPTWTLLAFVAAVYVVAYLIYFVVNRRRRTDEGSELEISYRLMS